MNQAIYFKTSMFDVSKENENPINPIFGISLLEWLRKELAATLKISVPEAEDWGWYSTLEFGENIYLIGASAYYEPSKEPATEIEWVFQVDKHRSFTEKLLGKNKMSTSDSCFVYFKELFDKHPGFKEIEVG